MTRLGIDAVGAKGSGGWTVAMEILGAAISNPGVASIVTFVSPGMSEKAAALASERSKLVEPGRWAETQIGRVWWLERQLGRRARALNCDVLITLNGSGPQSFGRKSVTLVQQAVPFYQRDVPPNGFRDYLRTKCLDLAMRRGCRSAGKTVVQTAVMRTRVAQRYGVGVENILVLTPAPPMFSLSGSPGDSLLGLEEQDGLVKLLYVGSDVPLKNLAVVAGAVRLLRDRNVKVVVFMTLPPGHVLVDGVSVIGLGYLDRASVRRAYELADATVMPSLVETVGLPMIESMSVGTPVIAADRPYAREICGEAAVYFNPKDEASLADQVQNLMADRTLRLRCREAGLARCAALSSRRPYDELIELAIKVGEV